MTEMVFEAVKSVRGPTRAALGILAIASGYYTFLGARELINAVDRSALIGAAIYAAAVAAGIYVFWLYVLAIVPAVASRWRQVFLCLIALMGCGAIVAMSSWLNATAIAGHAAITHHLAVSLEALEDRFVAAHDDALRERGLSEELSETADWLIQLSEAERSGGVLTGSVGSGAVSELMGQIGERLRGMSRQAEASQLVVATLAGQGEQILSGMRAVIRDPGPIAGKVAAFGDLAVSLTAVISQMGQTRAAQSIGRAGENLAEMAIMPATSRRDQGLAARQEQVMEEVRTTLAHLEDMISASASAAKGRLSLSSDVLFDPLNAVEAVVRYADKFAPSWAGAVAIDLLPLILLLILLGAQPTAGLHVLPAPDDGKDDGP